MSAHACTDGYAACRNLHTIEAASATSMLATAAARRAISARKQHWTEALVIETDVHAVLDAWVETAPTWSADSSVLKPADWDDVSVEMAEEARSTYVDQATAHVHAIITGATDHLQSQLHSDVHDIPGIDLSGNVEHTEPDIVADFMFDWEELAKSGGQIFKDVLKRGTFGATLAGGAGSGAAAVGVAAGAGALRAALGVVAAGLPAVGAVNEWRQLKKRLRNEIVKQVTSESAQLAMHLRGAVNETASITADLLAGPLLAQLDAREQHLAAALDIASHEHATLVG